MVSLAEFILVWSNPTVGSSDPITALTDSAPAVIPDTAVSCTKASLCRSPTPTPTAMPTLPLPLPALASAAVGLPSARVWELVTEGDETSSLPDEVTLPVVSTYAVVWLTTVPTATAPAKLILPPLLSPALLSETCLFDS